MDNAYYRGVPGIVVSREGIYSYGPEYREDLNNPKGYAKPVDPPAVPKAVLAMAAPPPWVVPYQWPEGTSSLNATDPVFSDTEADPTTNHDEGNAEMEVIVAEWSDEGIIYGEHLTESEN